jgi:hypothetical protein
MESLEQGREPRAGSPRRRVAVAVVLVALVAVGSLGWVIDARWRTAATADLALAFDESVTAIDIAERRVQSVIEYARPARERFDVDPDVRASLDQLVRETAADAEADIAVSRENFDAVSLSPWHSDLREARERARTWLDLRAAGITSLVRTGRATYPPREELDEARASLRAAWSALRAD